MQSVYGNGQNISYEYDDQDRVTAIKYNGATRYTYAYDANGNVGYQEDLVNGKNYKYIYDLSNRLVEIKEINGPTVKYGYDKNNNISMVTENIDQSTYTTNYSLDKDGRIDNISYDRGNSTSSNTEQFLLDGSLLGSKGTSPFSQNAIFTEDAGSSVLTAYESNTNILTNSSFEDGTNGWSLMDWNHSTGKWRVVDDGVFGGKSLESYDSDGLTDGSGTNSVAYELITLPSALSSASSYTLSAYAKRIGSSQPSLSIRCFDSSGNQLLYLTDTKEIPDSQWTRITQTYTAPVGTKTMYAIVRDGVKDGEKIRYDGIKFENNSFVTTYGQDTMTGTKVLYDLDINKNEGTISTWFKSYEDGTVRHVIANEGTDKEIFNIFIDTDNKLKISARNNAGNMYVLLSSTQAIQKDDWYFTALTWQMSGSTLTAKLYLNDQIYTATTTDIKDFTNGTTALGSSITGSAQLNGNIKKFTFTDAKLSDSDITSMYQNHGTTNINYTYDAVGRLTDKTTGINGNTYTTTYGFTPGINGSTSTQLQSINNNGSETNYTYDANGNIETITENGQTTSYAYNELNEVIRENNQGQNKTITYAYDAGGNITSRKEYAYTTGTLGTPTNTINYTYGDTNWKDKLTAYDGKAITYDDIGNPLTYDGYTYTWEEGRKLKTINKTGLNMSFKYNADGIRTEKTVNGATTTYNIVGDKVTFETNGTDDIYYTYDSDGNLLSMNLNGEEYYYIRNGQSDIIGIYDITGTQVVAYTYDTWGKLQDISGTLASTVGEKNPYRYRGYRYDSETGLYYLQSRYYNPEWGRFVNADIMISTGTSILGTNMYTYCDNNPALLKDDTGMRPAVGAGQETREELHQSLQTMKQISARNRAAQKTVVQNTTSRQQQTRTPAKRTTSDDLATAATGQTIFRTALSSVGTLLGIVGNEARMISAYGYAFATPFAIASHLTNGNLTTAQKVIMTGMEIAFAIGGVALAGAAVLSSIPVALAAGIVYSVVTYGISSKAVDYYEEKNRYQLIKG